MSQNKSHYHHLRDKWTTRHKSLQQKLWETHKESLGWLNNNVKQLTVGSLGSLMLLAAPAAPLLPSPPVVITASAQIGQKLDKNVFIISNLTSLLPKEVRPLSSEEEQKIAEVLSRDFGIKVKAELEGKRLNRSYGLIGAEQHLARFPGDNMNAHFDSDEEAKNYWSSGMAPGLGAWGYFSYSQTQMTNDDKMREKYYIAVQTFLSSDFKNRFAEYRDFFKYRKMLVVNPNNGKAIVAVIGDAGPAQWTGKHLGGSPEVMRYLERVDGAQKGPVLYFFIDDSENKVPLGSVE